MSFPTESFVANEKAVISELLDRMGQTSFEIRQAADEALVLGAEIAAARLRAENTDIAERALKVVLANLKAAAAVEVASAIVGYIEGALVRVATTAGAALITFLPFRNLSKALASLPIRSVSLPNRDLCLASAFASCFAVAAVAFAI